MILIEIFMIITGERKFINNIKILIANLTIWRVLEGIGNIIINRNILR